MVIISRHFLPHFFSFAIESYIYETDFTLGKYANNQNGNLRWFEMGVTLGPNNLAMFKVISTTIYT